MAQRCLAHLLGPALEHDQYTPPTTPAMVNRSRVALVMVELPASVAWVSMANRYNAPALKVSTARRLGSCRRHVSTTATPGQLSSSRIDYCYPWASRSIQQHSSGIGHRASGIGHRLVQSASASGIEHHAKARAVIDWRSSWVALEAEQEVVLLATGLIKSAACQDSLVMSSAGQDGVALGVWGEQVETE